MKKFSVIIFLMIYIQVFSQDGIQPINDKYFGQKPPGNIPELFLPGIISTEDWEAGITFSPDGMTAYFFRIDFGGKRARIMYTSFNGTSWEEPKTAWFSGVYEDCDPLFSPDGKRLYFSSKRPLKKGSPPKSDYNTWYVDLDNGGFTEPVLLPAPLNSDEDEIYASVSKKGTIYFCSARKGGFGARDYYKSEFVNGAYTTPVNLGPNINSKYWEGDGYISPNEDYFIYTSELPGNFGDADLYISFKMEDGMWSKGINMGEPINSRHLDYTPLVSPDGKYLYFARFNFETQQCNIYWVDAVIISKLKDLISRK